MMERYRGFNGRTAIQMSANREDQRSVFTALKKPLEERERAHLPFPFELRSKISSYLLNKCVYCRVAMTVRSYLSRRAEIKLTRTRRLIYKVERYLTTAPLVGSVPYSLT